MAIRLDNLKQPTSEVNSLENGYLYKDIDLDLSFGRYTKKELYSKTEPNDLSELQDGAAIINSVKNILTTTPGQKLLNPTIGLDLRSYLFESVSNTISYFIGLDIYNSLGIQEPRVDLNDIKIEGIPDENEYRITIGFSIPGLDIYNLSLNATLNKEGYVVV